MAEDLTPAADPDGIDPGAAVLKGPSVEVVVTSTDLELFEAPPATIGAAIDPVHARRFSFAYGLLGVVGLIAVVSFVVIAVGYRPGSDAAWSAFRPTGDRLAKASAIADYVAPRYHLDTGEQLALVRASEAQVGGNVPIEVIAIVKVGADGQSAAGYDTLAGASAITYQLCGLGEKCSIRVGTPSAERERLLRRQGLELALYTFKYVGDVDSVVIYMPPKPGKDPTIALLFRKGDLSAELSKPIDRTLGQNVPTPTLLASQPEASVVERLTGDKRYGFGYTQLQDQNAALVLDPSKTAT